jgi:hypothetical protein
MGALKPAVKQLMPRHGSAEAPQTRLASLMVASPERGGTQQRASTTATPAALEIVALRLVSWSRVRRIP